MKRKILCFTLILSITVAALLVPTRNIAAQTRPVIPVYLDGVLIDFGTTNNVKDNAVIINDYAYVPIARIILQLTGSNPAWNDATKTASFTFNNDNYAINTTKNGIYVNDTFIPSDTGAPPVIVNNRTLIPLNMLTGVMGFTQRYDDATRSTYLTSPAPIALTTENLFTGTDGIYNWITSSRDIFETYEVADRNNDQWQQTQTGLITVDTPEIRFMNAAFEVSNLKKGTAYLTSLQVREYDKNGNFVRLLYDMSADPDGFHLWSEDGSGKLKRESTYEWSVTGTNGLATVSRVYLPVKQGFSYQTAARVRIVNGNPDANVAATIDFFG